MIAITRVKQIVATAIAFAMIVRSGATGRAADDEKDPKAPLAVIVPTPAIGNVFGDQEAELKFRVEARQPIEGRLAWRFSIGTATVAAREVELTVGKNAPATISIKLPVPPVKDGVVLQTRLTLSVIEAGANNAAAVLERDLWVFPKDPFAGRGEWLKKRKIALFDPARATNKVFTAAKIPFGDITNAATIADMKDGLLIVGEGVSLKEQPELTAALDQLVTKGVVVLCLAPAPGEVSIPGIGKLPDNVGELAFRKDFVRPLDKRLDADGWLPDGKAIASSVVVKNGENGVVGEIVAGAGGWPWVEARAKTGTGRLAICGLGIVAKWDAGPTPRYLFAKLMEHLTDPDATEPKPGD